MLALNLEAWTAGGEGAWNGERGGEEGEGRGLGLGLGSLNYMFLLQNDANKTGENA